MSMQYIRDYYGVPAKRGGKIRYTGILSTPREGKIVGSSGQYLRVRFNGVKRLMTLHPTWQIEYL